MTNFTYIFLSLVENKRNFMLFTIKEWSEHAPTAVPRNFEKRWFSHQHCNTENNAAASSGSK
jgi:hypothetical protein